MKKILVLLIAAIMLAPNCLAIAGVTSSTIILSCVGAVKRRHSHSISILQTCLDNKGGKGCYKRDCEVYRGKEYCNYKECIKYGGGRACNDRIKSR